VAVVVWEKRYVSWNVMGELWRWHWNIGDGDHATESEPAAARNVDSWSDLATQIL